MSRKKKDKKPKKYGGKEEHKQRVEKTMQELKKIHPADLDPIQTRNDDIKIGRFFKRSKEKKWLKFKKK